VELRLRERRISVQYHSKKDPSDGKRHYYCKHRKDGNNAYHGRKEFRFVCFITLFLVTVVISNTNPELAYSLQDESHWRRPSTTTAYDEIKFQTKTNAKKVLWEAMGSDFLTGVSEVVFALIVRTVLSVLVQLRLHRFQRAI
jgi:hypothetical protein